MGTVSVSIVPTAPPQTGHREPERARKKKGERKRKRKRERKQKRNRKTKRKGKGKGHGKEKEQNKEKGKGKLSLHCSRHTRFCVLWCQPVPIRRLSRARTAQLTLRSKSMEIPSSRKVKLQ